MSTSKSYRINLTLEVIIDAQEQQWLNSLVFYCKYKKIYSNSVFRNFTYSSFATLIGKSVNHVKRHVNTLKVKNLIDITPNKFGGHNIRFKRVNNIKFSKEYNQKETVWINEDFTDSEIKAAILGKQIEFAGGFTKKTIEDNADHWLSRKKQSANGKYKNEIKVSEEKAIPDCIQMRNKYLCQVMKCSKYMLRKTEDVMRKNGSVTIERQVKFIGKHSHESFIYWKDALGIELGGVCIWSKGKVWLVKPNKFIFTRYNIKLKPRRSPLFKEQVLPVYEMVKSYSTI